MKPNYPRLAIFLCILVFGITLWAYLEATRSPLDAAIIECAVCGLDERWVLQTVEDIRDSGQSREQAINSWEETYRVNNPVDLPEAQELCMECVVAVVEVAKLKCSSR